MVLTGVRTVPRCVAMRDPLPLQNSLLAIVRHYPFIALFGEKDSYYERTYSVRYARRPNMGIHPMYVGAYRSLSCHPFYLSNPYSLCCFYPCGVLGNDFSYRIVGSVFQKFFKRTIPE